MYSFFTFSTKFNSHTYTYFLFFDGFNSNIYSFFMFSTKFNSKTYSFIWFWNKLFKMLTMAVFNSIKYSFNKKTWVSDMATSYWDFPSISEIIRIFPEYLWHADPPGTLSKLWHSYPGANSNQLANKENLFWKVLN